MSDTHEGSEPPHFGGHRYSSRRRCLVGPDGRDIALRPQTLAVFRALAARADSIVDRDVLFEEVWGQVQVTDDSLGKCVAEIRRAIGDDKHEVLRTVPRQGYMLVSDLSVTAQHDEAGSTGGAMAEAPVGTAPSPHLPKHRSPLYLRVVTGALLGLAVLLLVLREDEAAEPVPSAAVGSVVIEPGSTASQETASNAMTAPASALPQGALALAVSIRSPEANADDARRLVKTLRAALSRYRTVRLVDGGTTELVLSLELFPAPDGGTSGARLAIELDEPSSNALLFAETFELGERRDEGILATRIAAMVASPGSGHVARHLIHRSRHKPAADLVPAECYAHGYDCTNCSGELDSVDERAETCLAKLLRNDPNDARAWALQSTIFAHQFQWGTRLPEPGYSDWKSRGNLPQLAIDAATRAEYLADGEDSAVYWGMTQAYSASCDIDKMQTAIERGLAINPDDPNLLGVFGNWLAYAGRWDEGVAMIDRALEIEPIHYRRWWLFGKAKRHYSRGEYEAAHTLFLEAFNERNWLSHLQLAYTLPHLGRIDEAKAALARVENLFPGITIERAVQLYSAYCFPEPYLRRMIDGLEKVGMPTRGSYADIRNPDVPHARITSIGDWDVEYMDLGKGTPVVFVHGAMSDYRSWGHYQNAVSEDHRYISYSRRLHGSQDWPEDPFENYSPEGSSEDLGRFIDALGLESVFLVGWSSGAVPILHLARVRPDLIDGIVLYEPVIDTVADSSDKAYPAAARERFGARFGRVMEHLDAGRDEAATRAFLENVFEMSDGEFDRELMPIRRVILDNVPSVRPRMTQWQNWLNCEDLQSIEEPALIVGGEQTHDWWQYLTRKFADCLPNAEHRVLEGVRHDGPIRRPPEFFAMIDGFVRKHRR